MSLKLILTKSPSFRCGPVSLILQIFWWHFLGSVILPSRGLHSASLGSPAEPPLLKQLLLDTSMLWPQDLVGGVWGVVFLGDLG